MASVTSLGIHRPSAVPFLVAEGILPSEPSPEVYKWHTIPSNSPGSDAEEEELLSTEHCVVWSRGAVVQRVFRFDVEKEPVTHALFTHFDTRKELGNHGSNDAPKSHCSDEPREVDGVGLDVHVRGQPAFRSNFRARPRTSNVENDRRRFCHSADGDDWFKRKGSDRALVVLLKTQAYVFFLSGTTHIVHLPFEVDRAFSLPNGLLLQRRLSQSESPSTPIVPSVPQNSFAYEALVSSQAHSQLNDLRETADPTLPFLPMLNNLLQQATGTAIAAELPSLYYLTDPLTEVGVIVTQNGQKTTRYPGGCRSMRAPTFDTFDPAESLLYVSQLGDLALQASASDSKSPLLLAVSWSRERREYAVWSVEYLDHESSVSAPNLQDSKAARRNARRRSSYGPGASTGASTPVTRGANVGRDSFGVSRSRNSAARDLLSEDNFNDGEDNLVSHLESALDNPSIPMKTSRRVSSLLARADLSSGIDKTAFSDLAGGYPPSMTTRRGASLGSHGTRISSVAGLGSSFPRTQHSSGVRASVEPHPVAESYVEDTDDDYDEGATNHNTNDSSLHHQFLGLRREMILTKIHHTALEKTGSSYQSDKATDLARSEIFILKPPAHVVRDGIEDMGAFLCITDHSTTSLLVVSLRLPSASHNIRSTERNAEIYASNKAWRRREIRVGSIRRSSGVIDACKICDVDCSRLLIMSYNASGQVEISLQDPWNPPCAISMPAKLFLYNPYQVVITISPKQKREGGFKRILSQSPRTLTSLSHGGSRETANIIDAEGNKHRIRVQLQPLDPFVRTMIKLCDSILPSVDGNREQILSAWWNVMAWLSARPDVEDKIEWTAFVVVLCSIAAGFVEDRLAETATRQKKRKSGLLRSSSGANTNMESWDAMLVEESNVSSSVPLWMQGEAWAWSTKQPKVSIPPQTSVPRKPRSSRSSLAATLPPPKKSTYLLHCMSLARDFRSSSSKATDKKESFPLWTQCKDDDSQRVTLATLLIGLHLLREEYKLDVLASNVAHDLNPVLAQLGGWLKWPAWGFDSSAFYMLENVDMGSWLFDDTSMRKPGAATPAEPFHPPSIMQFIEAAIVQTPSTPFISLHNVLGHRRVDVEHPGKHKSWAKELVGLTPRTVAISGLLTARSSQPIEARVAEMISWGWDLAVLETLPESVAISFRAAISTCQARPPPGSDKAFLDIVGRQDISIQKAEPVFTKPQVSSAALSQGDTVRDIHSICASAFEVDTIGVHDGTAEADRLSTTRMIFGDDQRFGEAAKLLHPLNAPVAKCVPEPGWSDTELLEAQQELAKTIAMRTLAVSPGRSCLFYSARLPLLTEKFPIHGFTLSCVMMPSNTTVTADKVSYTEEKVSWAFFHAGVEAGLSISKSAKGIDSSWILFNKPQELRNRHAGFLLALGLNGHLRSIAKWVSFKYLTPKHTMTSIGLLLGLAASYLGTMNTLITRLLSVHVTRMLPPGAADLNLSPLTQTSGIMGIGLLYCGTQHRRMSEIMLSEMEYADEDDSSNPQDSLRDEGYRLAAGFALGYINLGSGKDLKGLHDMHIVERLLALAIGTKKVTIVHILDKATAAATVAIALIFMKTHDEVLARKIDIPDTVHQFEYVRPDIFLLRTVARHLIMWNDIRATSGWVKAQLPMAYQYKATLTMIRTLNSEDMPFFNIIAGLCLTIGLRYAGNGSTEVRNLLCHYLDQFIRICKLPVLNYDGRLTRITVRNCQDVVALAAACVVSGTGDLHVFRRLRSLHGRAEIDVPYGSHLVAHLAIGVLFLGGGTHAFATSDMAVASLLCAFYPLFPMTVLDNQSHLQAFRHFWVLAAEARCLVTYDIDTRRLIAMTVAVTLKGGSEVTMTTPCLLPELNTVAKVQTTDPEYWSVTLDLAGDSSNFDVFKRHGGIWVRRRAAYDAQSSLFSTTIQALNDVQSAHMLSKNMFEWVFELKVFQNFDRAELLLVLPPDLASVAYRSTRGTAVDDRLVLENACMGSGRSERLWNLRVLFVWADMVSRSGGQWGWVGKEVVERLKTRLMMKKLQR